MQITTKRRFVLTMDEDEAEEFLDDPQSAQSKVRELLYSGNGHSAHGADAP